MARKVRILVSAELTQLPFVSGGVLWTFSTNDDFATTITISPPGDGPGTYILPGTGGGGFVSFTVTHAEGTVVTVTTSVATVTGPWETDFAVTSGGGPGDDNIVVTIAASAPFKFVSYQPFD